MDPLLAELYDRLSRLHEQIHAALDSLPDEALDWVPGPEMNSLAVLVAHTAGSERYWIGDVAGQEPSGRVRSEEFETSATSAAALLALLDTTLTHSHSVLDRLTIADLALMRPLPDGRVVSAGWAILHALEHTGLHTGHIELTRQLWDQRGR